MEEKSSSYAEVSERFKEIVNAVTLHDVNELRLYLIKMENSIKEKKTSFYSEYGSVKELFNTLKEAKGKVLMHFASGRGNVDIVRHLIEKWNVDHTIRDKNGVNPFMTAVEHGHLDLTRYFIEELKYSPNEERPGSGTCLHAACSQNNVQIISYLLEKGADIERTSLFGKPLNWAVGSNNFESTKLLLEKKANPNGDYEGTNPAPLILAIDFENHDIYHELMKYNVNVNVKDPNGYPVLFVAAEKGSSAIVKELIEKGADPNVEANGKTALHCALEKNQWDVVTFLKGLQPNHHEIEQEVSLKLENEKKEIILSEENKIKAQEFKNEGNILYQEKKMEEAINKYEIGLSFDPENEVIHRNLAACFLALNKYELALKHCEFAKKKDPKNVKTLYREASAYIGLENYLEAACNLWECSIIEPGDGYFRKEFVSCSEKAKKQFKK